jgi:4-amino-4-deoxychorismate lyase
MITIATRSSATTVTSRRIFSFASLDGVATDAASLTCSVWDVTFQRGDGVFEVCRVMEDSRGISKPRCVSLHLDRLERSAAAIDLPLPPREELEKWIRDAAASQTGVDGIVRCMVTRGGGSQGYGHHLSGLHAPSSTFIMWQPFPPQPECYRLLPMCAPWHPAGFENNSDWDAVKWLSYGPNVHTTRIAQKQGYDDALLLARGNSNDSNKNRIVLDGPNWALAWKRNDGVLCTPSWKDLGLLQSTSCTILLEAAKTMGIPVEEGIYRLENVERHAAAFWAMSTTRDLIPVV